MTAFRFIHSADLHLGRRFGNLPEEVRARPVEARHGIFARLAAVARTHGAQDILLAGDTFDSETPTDRVWRQALAAMGAKSDLRWWLLPGNHDSLDGAEALWERLRAQAPANVRVITDITPIELAPDVVLLPAPLPRRYPGRDLTEWMGGCDTDPRAIRIGLAHGAIHDFSEEGASRDSTIPPDRAETARLDYLALGDWHGQMRIGARAAYAGTPEQDGFTHAERGACLAVTISAAGAQPQVERIETGQLHWGDITLDLVPGMDARAALLDILPADAATRRDHLLRVRAVGRARLSEHDALRSAAGELAPDFCHFALDLAGLMVEPDAADLDQIDHAGALRVAADRLAAAAADPTRAETDRRISAGALNRLYGYLMEDSK